MWEMLGEAAQHFALTQVAVVTVQTPGDGWASNACTDQRYSYSDWTKIAENRWIDGEWIMRSVYYQRIRTNPCDGSTTTELKMVGPEQLRQAVLGAQVTDVNRPSWPHGIAPGAPLRTSELPAEVAGVGSTEQPTTGTTANQPDPPSDPNAKPPFYPGLALLAGALIAAVSFKASKITGPLRQTAESIAPTMKTSATTRQKGLFFLDWLLNPLSKEFWTRRWHITVGFYRFAKGIDIGVRKAVLGFAGWLWTGIQVDPFSHEGFKWEQETLEFLAGFPGALWASVKHDWSTAFGRLGDVLFDPDMSGPEIQEWAQSACGVASDALLIGSGVQALRGWLAGARAIRTTEVARVTSHYPLAGVGLSERQIARVINDLNKGMTLEEALTKIRRADLIGQSGVEGLFEGIRNGVTELPRIPNDSTSPLLSSTLAAKGLELIGMAPSGVSHPYQFDQLNPGPLAGYDAANFAGGKYSAVKVQNDLLLYRAGEAGKPMGQWFWLDTPLSESLVRIDGAVKAQWIDPIDGGLRGRSLIDTVFEIKIPRGTVVYIGPVGPQGGVYLGGTPKLQVFVPKPWNIFGVEIKRSWRINK